MAKCLICGRPLPFVRGLHSITCEECEPLWPDFLAKRKLTEAKAIIESEIEYHLKNEKIQGYGIAFWDTKEAAVSAMFGKMVGSMFLGGLGSQMTGKTHRLGFLVLSESKFWIIDMGEIVGEKIVADTFLGPVGHGKSIAFALKDLILQEEVSEENTLTIINPVQLKMTFSSFSIAGNNDIAYSIAEAIKTAKKQHPE
jgi:chromosomal replication initiation ATPase DnaA